MYSFTSDDLAFIRQRGSAIDDVQQHLDNFQKGFPFARLDRAATAGDGIVQLDADAMEELAADYADLAMRQKIVKFVPASGAASRMFKQLFSFLSEPAERIQGDALAFLADLPKYPFYEALTAVLQRDGYDIAAEIARHNYPLIVRYLLQPEGLNYGNLPKGLLAFHRYTDATRTAIEEHLVEAACYASSDGTCHLHFTVSPQHQSAFEALLAEKIPHYEAKYNVTYQIDFSTQDPATDTLAVTTENLPFRDEQGRLLFRPAGHGALIHNLNRLDADIAFVKNIDNVITEDRIAPTVLYKKVLAAYLLQLQARTFNYLRLLDEGEPDEMMLCEILDFAESELMIAMDDDFSAEALKERLNRPIRVCGMVRNEGEPGGGPFWVLDDNDNTTLQIVESSQIDKSDNEQAQILAHATHFNPVDMVCGLKDYRHNAFNLLQYVDAATGFISSKSYGDRTLKAQELPGLWNGAMSRWITVFVEVPKETFNPVKTVFDLLRR